MDNKEYLKIPLNEMCQEMMNDAITGKEEVYIQIPDIKSYYEMFEDASNVNDATVTIHCSLLTEKVLNYDTEMFRMMSIEDEVSRTVAFQQYRPYLFNYVIEANKEKLRELQGLWERHIGTETISQGDRAFPYRWFECKLDMSESSSADLFFDGYICYGAGSITFTEAKLQIIEDKTIPETIKCKTLDAYALKGFSQKTDDEFINSLKKKLNSAPLSSISAYKVGNGNCVYLQSKGCAGNEAGKKNEVSFFYDIGYHCCIKPKKLAKGVKYTYSDTMRIVKSKSPSFIILSHWHMDHISGSYVAKKSIFDKEWFAPDCWDARQYGMRLAKYLELKGHLNMVSRPSTAGSTAKGRKLGEIEVACPMNPSKLVAKYKFYMGEKSLRDSKSNCEGIFIEYIGNKKKEKKVLMLGDVNYSSVNIVRSASLESSLAKTYIDYLIAPHHGSKCTGYKKLRPRKKVGKRMGEKAIICCTNNIGKNRPNINHLRALKKRFKNVVTTEEATGKQCCKYIRL